MRCLASLLLVTIFVTLVNAEENKISPGQEKMGELSGFIGTWRSTDNNGTANVATFKWINNKSFIEMIAGDYREIVGWDLTDEKITSWGFGTHGGQGKVTWKREDGTTWSRTSNWLDRWGNEALITSKVEIDGDEMQWTVRYGENEPVTVKSKRIAE